MFLQHSIHNIGYRFITTPTLHVVRGDIVAVVTVGIHLCGFQLNCYMFIVNSKNSTNVVWALYTLPVYHGGVRSRVSVPPSPKPWCTLMVTPISALPESSVISFSVCSLPPYINTLCIPPGNKCCWCAIHSAFSTRRNVRTCFILLVEQVRVHMYLLVICDKLICVHTKVVQDTTDRLWKGYPFDG